MNPSFADAINAFRRMFGRPQGTPVPRTEAIPTLFRVTRNGVVYKYAVAFRRVWKLAGYMNGLACYIHRVRFYHQRYNPCPVIVPIKWHARQHERTRRTPIYDGR